MDINKGKSIHTEYECKTVSEHLCLPGCRPTGTTVKIQELSINGYPSTGWYLVDNWETPHKESNGYGTSIIYCPYCGVKLYQ